MADEKLATEQPRERNLPGPVFYLVAVFQSLGFHVPYFFLPENPLGTVLSGRSRRSNSAGKAGDSGDS